MSHSENQYLQSLKNILEHGNDRVDRTGVGTRALFGTTLRFDLTAGFPIHTTKKVFWKTAFKEMLLFLNGSHHLRDFLEMKVRVWTAWPLQKYHQNSGDESLSTEDFEKRILEDDDFSEKWGDLGPIYGKQWRRWRCEDGSEIDQVSNVVKLLREQPASRRILWDGWNVAELDQMALPPCHKHYQFFVADGRLSGAVVVRSNDFFLGQPFNQVALAMLTHILAQQTGYDVGEIVYFALDSHIYQNHFEQVREQLKREPRALPELKILRKPDSVFDYRIEDFRLDGYDPHPAIKGEVAV